MTSKNLSSVWLIPDEKDQSHLRDIINRLASKYGTDPFIPHITIYGGIEIELDNLIKVVEDSISRIEIWDMNIPNWKKLFTKNL